MEAANIKIFDLIGGASISGNAAVNGQNPETGKLSDSGFAALFGDLVDGTALVDLQTELPVSSIDNAIVAEKLNSDEELNIASQLIDNSSETKQTKNVNTLLEQLKFEQTDENLQLNKEVKVVEVGQDDAKVSGKTANTNQQTKPQLSFENINESAPLKVNIGVNEISDQLKELNVKEVAAKSFESADNSENKMPAIDSNGLKIKETVGQNKANQSKAIESHNPVQVGNSDKQSSFEQNEFSGKQADTKDISESKTTIKTDESNKKSIETDTVIKSASNATQIKNEQSVGNEFKASVTQSIDKTESANKDIQNVKITIPETTKLNSGQRHQSIMIRIEPDHLGPARLDLNLRHDVFNAKLTVETVEAKAVLEHSIHSLKEQLARADIKVEQIQINVRGETNYNQMFDRQPQWQRQSNMNQFRINNEDVSDTTVESNQSFIPAAAQYVNTGGVNVLA